MRQPGIPWGRRIGPEARWSRAWPPARPAQRGAEGAARSRRAAGGSQARGARCGRHFRCGGFRAGSRRGFAASPGRIRGGRGGGMGDMGSGRAFGSASRRSSCGAGGEPSPRRRWPPFCGGVWRAPRVCRPPPCPPSPPPFPLRGSTGQGGGGPRGLCRRPRG